VSSRSGTGCGRNENLTAEGFVHGSINRDTWARGKPFLEAVRHTLVGMSRPTGVVNVTN
jgi:hypothetical protein